MNTWKLEYASPVGIDPWKRLEDECRVSIENWRCCSVEVGCLSHRENCISHK